MTKKLFFFTIILLTCNFAVAGVSLAVENSITVHKANYTYFLSNQKPDSVEACFLKSVGYNYVSEAEKGNLKNKIFLDSQLLINNIRFFRCFFRNSNSEVYRYVDISADGKIVREATLSDAVGKAVAITEYYSLGAVLSMTNYLQDTVRNHRNNTAWYGLSPFFVKNGTEKIYHDNGTLRISKEYRNGVAKDTVYTEYFPNGKLYRIYTLKDGRINGGYKVFDTSGKLIVDANEKVPRQHKTLNDFDAHKKAFLFGINHFSPPAGEKWADSSYWLSDLHGCENDISLLRKTLIEERGFDPKNIVTIASGNGSKVGVLAELKALAESIHEGDIVFMHFSSQGFTVQDSILPKYNGLSIACRDAYKSGRTAAKPFDIEAGYLYQFELESAFNAIRTAAGSSGQFYLSIDVCHAGALADMAKTNSSNRADSTVTAFRGEDRNLIFNLVQKQGAPVFIYTATSKDEIGYERRSDDGKSYGAYSYALAKALSSPFVATNSDLYQSVCELLKLNATPQTPGYVATETQFLFESNKTSKTAGVDSVLKKPKPSGNAFVLSIGISKYNTAAVSGLRFDNSSGDAGSYATYFSDQYKSINSQQQGRLTSVLLQNENATRQKILAAINLAIDSTKPDDYFIFNFSGYCRPVKDSAGKKTTWFIPYGIALSDEKQLRDSGISLKQLKDLLQLIPANNQLFITEAGATADFNREFIQALIETSPTIAALSKKNRIFIVPKSSGLDNCICNNRPIAHGPINYYLIGLDPSLNIFGLFAGGMYADAVQFALQKAEAGCNYFRTGYFSIFFERDFVKDLRYFLPEDVLQTRGVALIEADRKAATAAIANRYALVIGVDNYKGKPDWSDLGNPCFDAREIDASLRKNFGYKTTLLLNTPIDSIYQHILQLSRILHPSDQFLVYFAGHGDFDERLLDDGFIVCSDSKPVKDDPFRNSYIQYSKLSRMINKLPTQQILMILDVCFGGTFDERVAKNQGRDRNLYNDLALSDFIDQKLKKKTRLYLTSGGKKEVPDGYRGRHSPFALRLLDALQAKGGDKKLITAGNLHEFVKMLPSGPLIGSFGDDEPGSEFIMVAGAEAVK